LEAEQQNLYVQMSAPDFYARAGADIAQTKKRLEQIEASIHQAYERWEELQSLTETA